MHNNEKECKNNSSVVSKILHIKFDISEESKEYRCPYYFINRDLSELNKNV